MIGNKCHTATFSHIMGNLNACLLILCLYLNLFQASKVTKWCVVCHDGGNLFYCTQTCRRIYHLNCYIPTLPNEPPADWVRKSQLHLQLRLRLFGAYIFTHADFQNCQFSFLGLLGMLPEVTASAFAEWSNTGWWKSWRTRPSNLLQVNWRLPLYSILIVWNIYIGM